MKKRTTISLAVLGLLVFPSLLQAQWGAVRFDHSNSFSQVAAPSAEDIFTIGSDPNSDTYFLMKSNSGGVSFDSLSLGIYANNAYYTELTFVGLSDVFVSGIHQEKQILLHSQDQGLSWSEKTPTTQTNQRLEAIQFLSPQLGFSSHGNFERSILHSTTNGGMSWSSDSLDFHLNDLYFFDANHGIASGNSFMNEFGEVWETFDGGQTWESIFKAYAEELFVRELSHLQVLNDSTFFTFMENTHFLYRTQDAGLSWDTLKLPAGEYINTYAFSNFDTGRVLSYNGNIFATHDAGLTWELEYSTSWDLYGPQVQLMGLTFVGNTGYCVGTNGLIKKFTPMNNSIFSESGTENDLQLYPNPIGNSEHLHVRLPGIQEQVTMELRNALGEILIQKELPPFPEDVQLEKVDFPSGIYLITLRGKTAVFSKQLVVQ